METMILLFKLLGMALLISAVFIAGLVYGYWIGKGMWEFINGK